MKGGRHLSVLILAAFAGASGGLRAQTASGDKELGWSNATEFSLVVTEGNSDTESLGFRNTLRRTGERTVLQLKLDGVRTNSADDRFLLLESGLTWEPGEPIPPGGTRIVEPEVETDAERYFAEGKVDRTLGGRLFWGSGGSWERNEDAGILNRYIAFAGLGHAWRDDEALTLKTSYGLSYTHREEDEPDPEKDDSFAGVRVGWLYAQKLGQVTEVENDVTANVSLKNSGDYTLDMHTSVAVNMSTHLALKASLQWLFQSEPALEDVDVFARVELIDPDGIPGNGDEFYRTVESGGIEIEIGDGDIRKEELDTIIRTSLVIAF